MRDYFAWMLPFRPPAATLFYHAADYHYPGTYAPTGAAGGRDLQRRRAQVVRAAQDLLASLHGTRVHGCAYHMWCVRGVCVGWEREEEG